jgi:peptidoglycan lytic transglycosylase
VIRRASVYVVAVLSVGLIGLGLPALGQASSGGAGLDFPGSGNAGSNSPTTPSTGAGKVSVSGNGITVVTRAARMFRVPERFTGSAGSSAAGDVIEIERRGRGTNGRWDPTAHGTAGPHGHFRATWPTNHIGQFQIRAVIEHSLGARAAAASPSLTITVYRPSIATWYSDLGSQTACGETLHKNTLGVANRTLPCGTSVALYYRGRTITVPVIDRGPYANHANWDLTLATAKKLHTVAIGVATIGAVPLPKH